MKRAFYIFLNEIKLYLQDKGDLAFGLLLPIITFALMYGAFGGDTLFTATAYVVDEDGGGMSTVMVSALDAVEGIDVELLSMEDADAKLDRSDLTFVTVIPEGFSAALENREPAELIFKQRGNGGQEGQIIASIVRGITDDINQQYVIQDQVTMVLDGSGIDENHIKVVTAQVAQEEQQSPSFGVVEEIAGGESPDFIVQYLPGIVTMYVLFTLTLSASTIVEERRRGTLERLLTTRLSVNELFFGKYMSSIGRGFIQTLILMALSYAVFNLFTPLSFVEALFIALIYTAAATSLGMIIAALARTQDSATWIGVVLTMAMVMLSGTFFEVQEGTVLATISQFSLNTYANDALRAVISESGSLGDTWVELGVLAGVAVIGFIISRLVFRAVPGGK